MYQMNATETYQLTTEDSVKGAPANISPLAVQFSPDGKMLTYLFPDSNGFRQICALAVDQMKDSLITGEAKTSQLFDFNTVSYENLSLQEQLRRERMRLFVNGVSSYDWIGDESGSKRLIIPSNGQIYGYELNKKYPVILYDGSAGDCVDPHVSPNQNFIAFVVDDDLYLYECNESMWDSDNITSIEKEPCASKPIRLTTYAAKGITCGLADYLAQEEMDRYRGFWWSPDSTMIAYTINDESMIPEYQILHQGKSDPEHVENHRYPFAELIKSLCEGKMNATITLSVVHINASVSNVTEAGFRHVPMQLIDDSNQSSVYWNQEQNKFDYYLARVGWWPDGSVMAQVQTRDQTRLEVLKLNPHTGERTVMFVEETNVWINLHDHIHCFKLGWSPDGAAAANDFYFLWGSERNGFMQLYMYKYDSGSGQTMCLFCVGGGDSFVIDKINAVDDENLIVYFTANKESFVESHLYGCSFDPLMYSNLGTCPKPHKLTITPGWHSATVDVKSGILIDLFSSCDRPPLFTLHNIPRYNRDTASFDTVNETGAVIFDNELSSKDLQRYKSALQIPMIRTIRSSDDKVDLICSIYQPQIPSSAPNGKYPAIVSVYGGPHVQYVKNHWLLRADMRAQKLSQAGYVVIKCDNRGSYRRGLEFEGAIKWDMGNLEVSDQIAAVQVLVAEGLVDPNRVGIFGWSYGGYMSAMSICRAASNFHCAVAGAPVTSWDGYDTHYTERYMGTPVGNPSGYDNSSVMKYVSDMTGRLLLVHGLIDENVHFRHTARLINALIAARKRYDLVLFPCERHSPHKLQDRIYMEECICSYFNDHLQYRESTAPTVTSSPSLLLDSNTPAMKSVTLSAHL